MSFPRRIVLAFKAFFLVLFSSERAEQVSAALVEPAAGAPSTSPKTGRGVKPKQPTAPPPPKRSEALTLLAALQREARLVDFLQEPLTDYTDAQIGAAVRDVHREAAATIARMFNLRPLLAEAEGAEVDIPAGFDAGRYRLVGNVTGEPPYRGRLAHHGWEAAKVEVPTFSGSEASARVVAPAEVEL